MLADRLQELEVRVRETVKLLDTLRSERRSLEAKVASLEAELARGAADLKAVAAERDQERSLRQRLEAEREEARVTVDGLLSELDRIEAAVREGAA